MTIQPNTETTLPDPGPFEWSNCETRLVLLIEFDSLALGTKTLDNRWRSLTDGELHDAPEALLKHANLWLHEQWLKSEPGQEVAKLLKVLEGTKEEPETLGRSKAWRLVGEYADLRQENDNLRARLEAAEEDKERLAELACVHIDQTLVSLRLDFGDHPHFADAIKEMEEDLAYAKSMRKEATSNSKWDLVTAKEGEG